MSDDQRPPAYCSNEAPHFGHRTSAAEGGWCPGHQDLKAAGWEACGEPIPATLSSSGSVKDAEHQPVCHNLKGHPGPHHASVTFFLEWGGSP